MSFKTRTVYTVSVGYHGFYNDKSWNKGKPQDRKAPMAFHVDPTTQISIPEQKSSCCS